MAAYMSYLKAITWGVLMLVASGARAEAESRDLEGPPSTDRSAPAKPDEVKGADGQSRPPGESETAPEPEEPTPDVREEAEVEGRDERVGPPLQGGDSPPAAEETDATPPLATPGDAAIPHQAETDQKSPSDGSLLTVETDPPGALVTIGYSERAVDQTVGETPINLQLVADTYYVTLSKEGYETATAKVAVAAGEENALRVRLTPNKSDRVRGVRIAGNLVLWPGLATAAAGIILIVVDDPTEDRNTGKPGFALVGCGVTMVIAGALMLGLTYRDRGVYTMPDATARAAPPPLLGRRGMITLTRAF
jgi:hypothetical protein